MELINYLDEHKAIYIVSYNDIDKLGQTSLVNVEAVNALIKIKDWANNHLCNPHPELGRKGHVCPYTLASIKKRHFWLSPYSFKPTTPEKICDVMFKYMESFLETQPKHTDERIFKTFVVVFHKMSFDETSLLIDYTHKILKPSFVENGLMLGQFHDNCNIGGVHNSNFMSLHSPIPLFVIRNMVVNDYMFLNDEQRFIDSYNKHFSGSNSKNS